MSPKRKILLVSANTLAIPYPVYPLGISYLFTYLKKHLHQGEVTLFDFNCQSMRDFTNLLSAQNFDLIGFSLRNIDDSNIFEKNSFIAWYKEIVKAARDSTSARIVIGGPGFSILPELIFDILQPDFGIKGEGEQSLLQLILCLEEGTDYTQIDGLVFRLPDSGIRVNPRASHLNSLELSFDKDLVDFYWSKSGMLNIQTKRGCPYHCIYCSYPVIEGRKVRTLNTNFIVDTLKDLYFNKGITFVFFTDSVFNISKEYNIKLAKQIIKSGVKVNWGAYFSPYKLDKESLSLFKQAGLSHIEFGTDSFSDQQLKNYRKLFKFDEVLEISRICYDLGIFYAHFLILGGYGETDKSLDETFENSKKIPLSVYFPYVGMRIYPHTELFDIAVKEGIISGVKDLIEPAFYISRNINAGTLKDRALATGKKWIFPDFDDHGMMEKFRMRNIRGPLWEFLRY